MRTLILGGTGSMGVSLVEVLKEKGEHITVTSRSKHGSDDFVEYIQGNAHDDVFLDKLLERKFDVIVDFMSYSTFKFSKRYKRILDSTGQYFLLSSSRVYADSPDDRISENSPRLLDVSTDRRYLATDEYALAKARQEDLLLNCRGNNYTIIRPYITYNTNRMQLGIQEQHNWIRRVIRENEIVFQRDISEHYTTLTYGLDVARAMACLIGNKNAMGEIFHITTGESHRWKDILLLYKEIIYNITGKNVQIVWQDSSKEIAKVANQYQLRYDRLLDRQFDNSKILGICGSGFSFTSLEDGINACFDRLLNVNQGLKCSIPWEAFFDRATRKNHLIAYSNVNEKLKYSIYRYSPFIPCGLKVARNTVKQMLRKKGYSP